MRNAHTKKRGMSVMKNIRLSGLLSFFLFFGNIATINAAVKGSDTAVSIEPNYTFLAADNDNKMFGFGWFKNGFSLEDATTSCTFDSVYPVSSTVNSPGSLYLEQDLVFKNPTTLINLTKLYGDSHMVDFCPSITYLGGTGKVVDNVHFLFHDNVTFADDSIFTGECCIDAGQHTITLDTTADLVIGSSSNVCFKNATIRLVGDGKIRCTDDSSSLVFDDVRLIYDGLYTFSYGAFTINGNVEFTGSGTFAYESHQTSSILQDSTLCICDNLVFSIGKQTTDGLEPLEMIDESSTLKFDSATFFITSSGMQLNKGALSFNKLVDIEVDSTTTAHALQFGDGTAESSVRLVIEPEGICNIIRGPIIFDTQNNFVISSISSSGKVVRGAQSILDIRQDLTFQSLSVEVDPVSTLIIKTGKTIDFSQGYFSSPFGRFKIDGHRYDTFVNLLAGNDSIFLLEGLYPLYTIVAGPGNTMRGSGSITNNILLQDSSAEVTLGIDGMMQGNIILNGGTVKLGADIQLGQSSVISGSGTIDLASHSLEFEPKDFTSNADIAFNSSGGSIEIRSYASLLGTFTFNGDCLINGDGNTINLNEVGKFVIADGVKLTLRNMRIEGIADQNIQCLGDSSVLELDNVVWVQDGDFLFDAGSIAVYDSVEFQGTYTFSYESSQTSTIVKHAKWKITDNMRFVIGRKLYGGAVEPLYFEDSTAKLNIDNSCFSITSSGIQLTKGHVIIDRDVVIELNSTSTENGLILGNGTQADDMLFEINPGSSVRYTAGHVKYDIVTDGNLRSYSATGRLIRDSGSVFVLAQDMLLSNMTVLVSPLSQLIVSPGKFLKYDNGIVSLPDGLYTLVGTRLNDYTNLFDGDDSVVLQNGSFPFISLIANSNNKFRGNGTITGPIMLQDSNAELILDLDGLIAYNISMQASKLTLADDAQFTRDNHVTGSGTLDLGGSKLRFGSRDFAWTGSFIIDSNGGYIEFNSNVDLYSTLTIQGECTIVGNGNELDLGAGGHIVVDSGATLKLKNIRLTGVSDTNICCVDDTASLILDDMSWIQEGDFSFAAGSITFIDTVDFSGAHIFDYATQMTSTISIKSEWIVSNGMRFVIGRKQQGGPEPLEFVDQSSVLKFDNCAFVITPTGITITKGHVICNRDVEIEIQSTDTTNGVRLGDGTLEGDMIFEFNPGCSVRYINGHLVFDVVTDGSMRSRSTTAQIIRYPSSYFYIKQNLTLSNLAIAAAVGSTLVIEDDKDLSYDDCVVVLPEGAMLLSGSRYDPFTSLLANGGSIFMQNGGLPLYTVALGTGNLIQGNGSISGGIILLSNSSDITIGLDGSLMNDITLNGGKTILDKDLFFSDAKTFKTTGTVQLDSHRINLGSRDSSWTSTIVWDSSGGLVEFNSRVELSGRWTFSGDCSISAHENVIDLSNGGEIIVAEDATLRLRNVRLQGVSGNNVRCLNDAGKIILDDVTWIQDDHYTFSTGSIQFINNVDFSGSYSFRYESSQTSTVDQKSTWHIADDMILSIGKKTDPTAVDPLNLYDQTSVLSLDKCTFNITDSGLHLKTGYLLFDRDVIIDIASTDTTNGLRLGDGTQSGLMVFEVNPGAFVHFTSGHLVYDVASSDNLKSRSISAKLIRSAESIFYINQDLVLSNVSIESDIAAQFIVASGKSVSYEDCVFVLPNGKIELTGNRFSSIANLLSGNDSMFIHNGVLPLGTIVAGTGNKIQGTGHISGSVILQDANTELIADLNGLFSTDIMLNGGTITLWKDLGLLHDKKIVGPGGVTLNSHTVRFGVKKTIWDQSIFWDCDDSNLKIVAPVDLDSTWTFSGKCTIQGNDNIFTLGASGEIVVEKGSTLVLRDLRIEDINQFNIRCLDDAGVIVLDNVTWIQDGNYTFTHGAMLLGHDTVMIGEHTFAYQTSQTSTICARSSLTLDTGFTFSYDPVNIASKELFAFEADNSEFVLHNATLHVTTTGLTLKKGVIAIEGKSVIATETTSYEDGDGGEVVINEGVSIGDGIDDCIVKIRLGSELLISRGSLYYKNLLSNSFVTENTISSLIIGSEAQLMLDESINLGEGKLTVQHGGLLNVQDGKEIVGSLFVETS